MQSSLSLPADTSLVMSAARTGVCYHWSVLYYSYILSVVMLDEIYSNKCSDQFLIKEYKPRSPGMSHIDFRQSHFLSSCKALTSVAYHQDMFPENILLCGKISGMK